MDRPGGDERTSDSHRGVTLDLVPVPGREGSAPTRPPAVPGTAEPHRPTEHPAVDVADGALPPGPGEQGPVGWSTARRRRLVLAAIVLVALAVRVAIVYRVNRHAAGGSTRLGGDEPEYDSFARSLLDGDWADYPIRGPGYPALLALLRLVTGGDYDVILYLQAVIGASMVLPTFALGRRLAGDGAGLVAAAGFALHWEPATGSAYLQSEVLFTPVLLLLLLLLLRGFGGGGDDSRRSARIWLAVGACLGVAAATRSTMLPLGVVVVAGVAAGVRPWRAGLRAAAAVAGAAVVVVAPITTANAVRFDAFVPVATTTGVVWQGSPAYDDLFRSGRSYGSIWERELNPDVNGDHSIATPEGDAHFTRLGLEAIRERPLAYLRYSVRKVAYLWLGHPSADWGDGRVLDPRSLAHPRWEVPLVMASRVVPLVALVALVVVVRRGPRSRALAVVAVALGSWTLLHAALWAELRLSQPMVPLLWVLIGAAAARAGRGAAAGPSAPAPAHG